MKRLMKTSVCAAALSVCAASSSPAHAAPPCNANTPKNPTVTLRDTVYPSALRDAAGKSFVIQGRVLAAARNAMTPDVKDRNAKEPRVLLRVTDSLGNSTTARATAKSGAFRVRYPRDFAGALPLRAETLFIDATDDENFDVARDGHFQAEAAVILYNSAKHSVPDLASAFTTDLLDKKGRRDEKSSEWKTVRALVNLYFRSQAARAIGVGKADFDLANAADMANFKNNFALYDFDDRDRDWKTPLNHRVARTYWKSVWNTWFNSTNDNPLDGDPKNQAPSNYIPYAFSNDFADILISYVMKQQAVEKPLDDNLTQICREGAENLLAMQHKTPDNFAIPVEGRKTEIYTAGAFRYGMFENGDFLVEGKGWFYNPATFDYVGGGYLNGRALWGIGEAIKGEPRGPLIPQLKKSLQLGVKFCLLDSQKLGYAHLTKGGHAYWKEAGEHAYLLIGMLAACRVAPDLMVQTPRGTVTLRAACVDALDALPELAREDGTWSQYSNFDSMSVAALAEGAYVLHDEPNAAKWRNAAIKAADVWMDARPDASEYSRAPVHFGLYLGNGRMTYNWGKLSGGAMADRNIIYLYQSGHWIHALSRLYAVTGEARYRRRAQAMISYVCGDNPWKVRLWNELGGVGNWVEDCNGDGIEDYFKQDMYPESTHFTQIGAMHLMRTLSGFEPVLKVTRVASTRE